jgi:hypothetical protein
MMLSYRTGSGYKVIYVAEYRFLENGHLRVVEDETRREHYFSAGEAWHLFETPERSLENDDDE